MREEDELTDSHLQNIWRTIWNEKINRLLCKHEAKKTQNADFTSSNLATRRLCASTLVVIVLVVVFKVKKALRVTVLIWKQYFEFAGETASDNPVYWKSLKLSGGTITKDDNEPELYEKIPSYPSFNVSLCKYIVERSKVFHPSTTMALALASSFLLPPSPFP